LKYKVIGPSRGFSALCGGSLSISEAGKGCGVGVGKGGAVGVWLGGISVGVGLPIVGSEHARLIMIRIIGSK
jgi:hypothetical protein